MQDGSDICFDIKYGSYEMNLDGYNKSSLQIHSQYKFNLL